MALSSLSLLNKVNVGNCFLLAKLHIDDSFVSKYAKGVEEFMASDVDLHSCNIIGMVGLFYFWRKLGASPASPAFPFTDDIFKRPSVLKNHVTFRCVLYMFDMLSESELIALTDFLFKHFDEPISLVCLNRVFDIVYAKLKTHAPNAIESFYQHFSKLKKEETSSLRHKFLLQDLEDIFSNKYKRAYPYMQDIRFLLSMSVESSVAVKKDSIKSNSKFIVFFNTQLRKIIFNVITKSEDPSDCFRRLLDLGLSKKQVSELLLVLLFCACKEKPYNEFYEEVLRMYLIRAPKTSKLLRGAVFKLLDLKIFINVSFCQSLVFLIKSLNLADLESLPKKAFDGLGKACLNELKHLINND